MQGKARPRKTRQGKSGRGRAGQGVQVVEGRAWEVIENKAGQDKTR
jgi:hypothetical protein